MIHKGALRVRKSQVTLTPQHLNWLPVTLKMMYISIPKTTKMVVWLDFEI